MRGVGGDSGRIAAPGIGGVSDGRPAAREVGGGGMGGVAADAGGVGGATRGAGAPGVAARTGGAGVAGVAGGGAGAFPAMSASRMTGVSRETRATTPGVKVGVGGRFCGAGVLNGVGYGIDGRAGGVGWADEAAGGGAAGAAGGASGAAAAGTAGGTGVKEAGVADLGAGAGIARLGRAGVTRPLRKLSGAAAASDSRTARVVASQAPPPTCATSIPTRMTAPQTEQRARTPPVGTLPGSTLKTELHSAHETFTAPP